MKCVFCKALTSVHEPIEHIIPQSLGNDDHVLKRGVVCGACNNYFASKVEKPFLDLPSIRALRFHENVPSKKGRLPVLAGSLFPARTRVEVMRDPASGAMSVFIPETHLAAVALRQGGRLYLPGSTPLLPSRIVSRFVAKVGVEALAQRLDRASTDLIDDEQLNTIKGHARFGTTSSWPVGIRQIYEPSAEWRDAEVSEYQIVHEFDFLFTAQNEIYFVLAIFGQEFCINLGGPSLEGWEAWLALNENASPLHRSNNAFANERCGSVA